MVSALLSHPQIDEESLDIFGRSPLAWASLKAKTEVVQLLVEENDSAGLSTDGSLLPSASPSHPFTACRVICDMCMCGIPDDQHHHHCISCFDLDMCLDCFELGARCFNDQNHTLRKQAVENDKRVEVVD